MCGLSQLAPCGWHVPRWYLQIKRDLGKRGALFSSKVSNILADAAGVANVHVRLTAMANRRPITGDAGQGMLVSAGLHRSSAEAVMDHCRRVRVLASHIRNVRQQSRF